MITPKRVWGRGATRTMCGALIMSLPRRLLLRRRKGGGREGGVWWGGRAQRVEGLLSLGLCCWRLRLFFRLWYTFPHLGQFEFTILMQSCWLLFCLGKRTNVGVWGLVGLWMKMETFFLFFFLWICVWIGEWSINVYECRDFVNNTMLVEVDTVLQTQAPISSMGLFEFAILMQNC